MNKLLLNCFFLFLTFSLNCFADKVIWRGKVQADGTPTAPIVLEMHKKYQIKVSGYVNLGKWIQNSMELANDACFEFNKDKETGPLETLKNSNGITVCDGRYQLSHIYHSLPFVAEQDRIHFWVYDTYYGDNTGAFDVEIIQFLD